MRSCSPWAMVWTVYGMTPVVKIGGCSPNTLAGPDLKPSFCHLPITAVDSPLISTISLSLLPVR